MGERQLVSTRLESLAGARPGYLTAEDVCAARDRCGGRGTTAGEIEFAGAGVELHRAARCLYREKPLETGDGLASASRHAAGISQYLSPLASPVRGKAIIVLWGGHFLMLNRAARCVQREKLLETGGGRASVRRYSSQFQNNYYAEL